MLATVVGLRRLDFTGRDGNRVEGWQVHLTYPSDDVEGVKADSVFIPDSLKVTLPTFDFGTVYEFVYEQTGFGARSRNRLVEIKEA